MVAGCRGLGRAAGVATIVSYLQGPERVGGQDAPAHTTSVSTPDHFNVT
jgi:hypothetical protein